MDPISVNFPSLNLINRILPSIQPIAIEFDPQNVTASTYFFTSNSAIIFFYSILCTLIVLSLLPVTMNLLSGLKETLVMALA